MSYVYLQTSREEDTYSLPDVEVWESQVWDLHCYRGCGDFEVSEDYATAARPDVHCPSCEYHSAKAEQTTRTGWFYQYGMPGYMPSSDESGPFDSEEDALADAREQAGYCPHGVADFDPCPACDVKGSK